MDSERPSDPARSPLEPRPAATVITLRDGANGPEAFMLRRSARSAFVPNFYVFPGGALDANDETTASEHGCSPLVVAAARESFEEAGFLFARRADGTFPPPSLLPHERANLLRGTTRFDRVLHTLEVRIDADAFVPFSQWTTPPAEVRRFVATFYVAEAPAEQIPEADRAETHDGEWVRPSDALARHAAGRFALIFPTIKHLERIAAFDSTAAILTFARAKTIVPVMPDVTDGPTFSLPPALENAW
jgi:8-oxo-dGTP pyrophosphatase MutT (NUDIX family)